MPLTIPSEVLSATTSDQTFTFSGDWTSVIIYNKGADPIQIEFDAIVDSGSMWIPSDATRSISIDLLAQRGKKVTKPLTFHYKVGSGTAATVYVTYVSQ